jgi:hypothetical protein
MNLRSSSAANLYGEFLHYECLVTLTKIIMKSGKFICKCNDV